MLCVSENGYGKLVLSDLYNPQKRGGKGVQTYKVTKNDWTSLLRDQPGMAKLWWSMKNNGVLLLS